MEPQAIGDQAVDPALGQQPDAVPAEGQEPALVEGQSPEGTPGAVPGDGQPQATVEIDGQQVPLDQVQKALKTQADYDQLVPEYTRTRQLLSDPEKLAEYVRQNHPDLLNPQQQAQTPDLAQALSKYGPQEQEFGGALLSIADAKMQEMGTTILKGIEEMVGPLFDQSAQSEIQQVNKDLGLSRQDEARILRARANRPGVTYREMAIIAKHEGLVKGAEERGRQQAAGRGPNAPIPTGGSAKGKISVKPYDPAKDRGKSADDLMQEGLGELGS